MKKYLNIVIFAIAFFVSFMLTGGSNIIQESNNDIQSYLQSFVLNAKDNTGYQQSNLVEDLAQTIPHEDNYVYPGGRLQTITVVAQGKYNIVLNKAVSHRRQESEKIDEGIRNPQIFPSFMEEQQNMWEDDYPWWTYWTTI